MKSRKTDTSSDRYKLLLLIIVLAGLLLRVYHIDFPPIGFHNMKEMQYLSEARDFYFHGDYLNPRIAWLEMGSQLNPDDSIQPPVLPWLILILWKIAGIHLWLARIIIVVFSLGSVVLAYYICRELTGKKELSIYAALFMAIMPIAVFFGRNIQPETPALFFMLLSTYYYLKWTKDPASKYMIASLLFFSIGSLFKVTFAIFAIPLLFVFPFEKLKDGSMKKKLAGQIPLIILSISPLFLWLLFLKFTGSGQLLSYGRINLFDIFRGAYWSNYYELIKGFLLSNFTVFYAGLTLIGLLLCLREPRTRFFRFCAGSALMVIPYSMLLSDYIRQHSYYQMPLVLLVSMASACALYRISAAVKNKNLKYAIVIGIIILTVPAVKHSIEEHYDRTFFGLDIAGETLNELSDSEDMVYI